MIKERKIMIKLNIRKRIMIMSRTMKEIKRLKIMNKLIKTGLKKKKKMIQRNLLRHNK